MKDHLREKSADAVVEHIYRRQIKRDAAVFRELVQANLAHVLMLTRCEIIGRDDAGALLSVLLELLDQGVEAVALDEQMESLYYSFEQHISNRVGANIGGKLHTARSRNDLGATVARMALRKQLLLVVNRACELRSTLLDVAQRNLETVMTGYTHLQPGQPITAAHYLVGIEEALQRDTRRMLDAYSRVNLSCLGAGAFAGTGFPIDREFMAESLGFAGFVVNTIDAVAARDYVAEFLSGLSILAITLSRLAQDLYVWSTLEFSLVVLPDRLVGTSSMMPQKRNAFVLESVKGRLSHVIGAWASSVTAMKNTTYSNVIDVNTESTYFLNEAISHTLAALELMRTVCEGVTFSSEHARLAAAANFSTATELADILVREYGLAFRDAHRVVAEAVTEAHDRGLVATDISAQMVASVALRVTGRELRLTDRSVQSALDPLLNVRARSHDGGPAPAAVERAIASAKHALEGDIEWWIASDRSLHAHEQLLLIEAGRVIEAN